MQQLGELIYVIAEELNLGGFLSVNLKPVPSVNGTQAALLKGRRLTSMMNKRNGSAAHRM